MRTSNSDNGRSIWLWVAIGAFIAAAIFVNPLREMTLEDDWAYALTVRGLMTTGHYQLNDWAAANMPLQAYWGALFCAPGGFSLGALRLSTVALSLFGLIAFHRLAREQGMGERGAGLLALVYLASPLLFRFSFNFMTDAPFMALLVGALWLYTRAIRMGSLPVMIVASIVAAASVLTRQHGVALIAGLFMVWAGDRETRRRYGFFIAGIVLPAAAALWQFRAGVADPTWAQIYSKVSVANYFSDLPRLLASLFWRPAVIVQYVAFFTLPLIPAAFAALRSRDSAAERARWIGRLPVAAGIAAAYLIVAMLAGRFILGAPLAMPILPWNFDIIGRFGTAAGLLLAAVVTLWGALLVGMVIAGRLASRRGAGSRGALTETSAGDAIAGSRAASPPALRMLGWTTLALLGLTLIFFKIGDEYILVFIPFALIAAGGLLRGVLERGAAVTAVASLVMLAVAALWTREILSTEEAMWNAGRLAVARGARPGDVDAGWNWASYHGAFERYLQSIDRRPSTSSDGYFQWFRGEKERARYVVSASRIEGDSVALVATVPFRTMLLRERPLYLYMRGDDRPTPKEGTEHAR